MNKPKKRVGIVSHYYKSYNYGGLLQSYALVKAFQKNGLDAYQIQYNSSVKKRSLPRFLLHVGNKIVSSVNNILHKKQRIDACSRFRKTIPHTKSVFNYKNISMVSSDFDAFVSGSDQVWNPSEINVAYSLSFTKKPKYSYAASIGVESIPKGVLDFYDSFLRDYKLISVRERNAIKLLRQVKQVSFVLDPVFLLEKEEWLSIASKRLCPEKYIFYYSLGDDVRSRVIVDSVAKEKGWKVFVIPYLNNKNNIKSGDLFKKDVSPNDFLSLIINAECVMTDSFHALCFSYIFKKDFYAFSRVRGEHMNIRIDDFLSTIDSKERLIESPRPFEAVDYSKQNASLFNQAKDCSRAFFHEMVSSISEN